MTLREFLEVSRRHYRSGACKPCNRMFVNGDCLCPISAGLAELGYLVTDNPVQTVSEILECTRSEVWSFIYGVDGRKFEEPDSREWYDQGVAFWKEIANASV